MNSSSSSSDCCCDDCYGVDSNTKSQRRVWRYPFYYNTTQPLVYYAQVSPKRKRPRSREISKASPNCFVKAFRWYTQEHVPPQTNQSSNFSPNMMEFAAWLDTKYRQFVRHDQLDQTSYLYKLQHTSSLEKYKIKETTSKNKRKKSVKRTPTSLRNRSNMTIVSTEVCNCKKPAAKSLSLMSVHQDNNCNATFLTKETIKEKKDTNDRFKVDETFKNISCQCVREVASKISTETQYENPVMNTIKSEKGEIKSVLLPGQICEPSSSKHEVIIKSLEEMPKKGAVKKIVQEFDPRSHNNISCQCTEEITKVDACCLCDSYITAWATNNVSQETNIPVVKHSTSSSKQVKSALTNTCNGSNDFKMSVHSAAQTSDHPLNLGNDLIHQYPFFMRIVCADKLCDDCVNS